MDRATNGTRLAVLLASCALSAGAWAQNADEPAPAPSETLTPEERPATEPDEPTLDELLGLDDPNAGGEGDENAALDEALDGTQPDFNEAALDRALSAEQLSEKFVEAIKDMDVAAGMIEDYRNVGPVVQRLQDEIVRNLEILIEQSQQQQGGGGSSSSSSQSRSQQSSAPQQPDQGQEQQQGQSGNQPGTTGEGGQLPEFEEGRNAAIDAQKAAWGALPERVRDALIQGASDSYSARYRALTEAYYRRLAEETTRRDDDQ